MALSTHHGRLPIQDSSILRWPVPSSHIYCVQVLCVLTPGV